LCICVVASIGIPAVGAPHATCVPDSLSPVTIQYEFREIWLYCVWLGLGVGRRRLKGDRQQAHLAGTHAHTLDDHTNTPSSTKDRSSERKD